MFVCLAGQIVQNWAKNGHFVKWGKDGRYWTKKVHIWAKLNKVPGETGAK